MSKRRSRMIKDFVSDVRSRNPTVRPMEGQPGRKGKGGYFIPTREGRGNAYRRGRR